MTLLLRYYSLNRVQLLLMIIPGNLILILLSRSLLINEIVFYNAYSEQLTYDRARQLYEGFQGFAWLSYVLSPVILLFKFSMISLLLYTGIIFNNLQYNVPFKSVFKIVVASDIVFIFAGLAKFLWFYLFAGNYDLNDIGFFYPLSVINIFKTDEIGKIWIYPMQTINLFHIAYLVLLAYGLRNICNISKTDSEKIVLVSYLPGLVIWLAFIMFITIDTIL
jgi:hypothetical protein